MKRVKQILISAALSTAIVAGSASAAPVTTSDRYRECTTLVNKDPKAASLEAQKWLQEKNSPSAQHCLALALFSLEEYYDAARELEQLSVRIEGKEPVLWTNVLRQAARAWNLADQRHRAIAALTRAILETSKSAFSDPSMGMLSTELLLERAAFYELEQQPLQALQDYDHGLSIDPAHERLLLARAKLLLVLKENALARQDLQLLLKAQPKHEEAKRLMSRI